MTLVVRTERVWVGEGGIAMMSLEATATLEEMAALSRLPVVVPQHVAATSTLTGALGTGETEVTKETEGL